VRVALNLHSCPGAGVAEEQPCGGRFGTCGRVAKAARGGPPSPTITRRGVLAGALALPWLASCSAGVERQDGVDLQEGTFSSRFWPDHQVRWRLAAPARKQSGPLPGPLVVALHGYGGDADWPFDSVHVERHVAASGLAVATIDGGNFYWHARSSGIDPCALVVADLLPIMARRGLSTDRIALMGWSMGGYGALLLASRLGPSRVAGVVATSAALWQSPGDRASGSFDDNADFARNDVFAALPVLATMRVRLACGQQDPFIVANQAFARGLPSAAATFDPGAHTEQYWGAHAGAQMSWLRTCFP
jgi:pimeloyl-ACP methyl ester carboxylesterase